jgi:transcriptional regulator with XRE-family HTH domain
MNPLVAASLIGPDGLATRLRAVRESAGMYGKDLAATAGWDPARVSKLELGRQIPTEDDVRAYVDICRKPHLLDELLGLVGQASAQRFTFRQRGAHGMAAVQRTYRELERYSTLIRYFETASIPGLIQVPDYARRVLTESRRLHELAVDGIEAAVTERIQRQQVLYDTAKQFEFLIAESALRWLIVPPAVMRAQLDRLQSIIGMPNVEVGIVPMGVDLEWTPQHSFQMFDDVAIVESFVGEVTYEGDEATQFARAMDLLWSEALRGDDARRLIVEAMSALPAH